MKKLLLVFTVAIGFVGQATAGVIEAIYDLALIYESVGQRYKQEQQQMDEEEEPQQKRYKKKYYLVLSRKIYNKLQMSEDKKLFHNLCGDEKKIDLSSPDRAFLVDDTYKLIDAYKRNRE